MLYSTSIGTYTNQKPIKKRIWGGSHIGLIVELCGMTCIFPRETLE